MANVLVPYIRKEAGSLQRRAMQGIADGRVDGNGFGYFGEEVWRNGNLRANLPFAAGLQGEFFHLLADGNRRHVAALRKKAAKQRTRMVLGQYM